MRKHSNKLTGISEQWLSSEQLSAGIIVMHGNNLMHTIVISGECTHVNVKVQ